MDEKKYIKYTTDKITDKYDLDFDCSTNEKTMRELILEAKKVAVKENIKANSIILNKKYVKTPHLFVGDGFLPPMVCGIEVYMTADELPDNYSFALTEKAQTERERLIGKTKSDTAKEIFEKIFEVLCCFTTQGKSEDYNEGYIDFLAEVDKRLQNLAKEEYGVDLGE